MTCVVHFSPFFWQGSTPYTRRRSGVLPLITSVKTNLFISLGFTRFLVHLFGLVVKPLLLCAVSVSHLTDISDQPIIPQN